MARKLVKKSVQFDIFFFIYAFHSYTLAQWKRSIRNGGGGSSPPDGKKWFYLWLAAQVRALACHQRIVPPEYPFEQAAKSGVENHFETWRVVARVWILLQVSAIAIEELS